MRLLLALSLTMFFLSSCKEVPPSINFKPVDQTLLDTSYIDMNIPTAQQKNILVERKKYFENQLNSDEKEFTRNVSNTLNSQLYSIRQELSILEADYISTKSREGDSHPAVLELNRKIKIVFDGWVGGLADRLTD